jgi:hypothetical protein
MGGGFALARYRVDGSLDPSFDGDRTMTADFGGRDYASPRGRRLPGFYATASMQLSGAHG